MPQRAEVVFAWVIDPDSRPAACQTRYAARAQLAHQVFVRRMRHQPDERRQLLDGIVDLRAKRPIAKNQIHIAGVKKFGHIRRASVTEAVTCQDLADDIVDTPLHRLDIVRQVIEAGKNEYARLGKGCALTRGRE